MSRLFHALSGRLLYFNRIYDQFSDQITLRVINTIGSITPEINSPKEFLLIAVANAVGMNSINLLFQPDIPNSLIRYVKKMETNDLVQIYRVVIQYYLYFFLNKLKPDIDKEFVLKHIYNLIQVDKNNFDQFCAYMDKWDASLEKKPMSPWDPFASITLSMGAEWNEETASHIFAAITAATKRTRDLMQPFNTYVDIIEHRN